MYYVYIIESSATDIFDILYRGSTTDYERRLKEHEEGLSTYTKGKGLWKLIFVQVFETIQEALIQEKKLKV